MKNLFLVFAFLFLSFFLPPLSVARAAAIRDELRVCDQYLDLDRELGCQGRGYLRDVGYEMCRDYVFRDPEFTRFGREVLARIRRCLVRVLRESAVPLTCDNVEGVGFASHAPCYVHSGFCELSFSDQWIVLEVGSPLLLYPQIWDQLFRIVGHCQHRSDPLNEAVAFGM